MRHQTSRLLAAKAAAPIRSIVLFVLVLAVAAIGALAWKEYDSLQYARNAVRAELQMQTLSQGAVFETAFESAEQIMAGIANRVEYNPAHPDVPLDLRKRLLRSPSLGELRFYAADGHLGERAGLTPLASNTLPAWVQQAVDQGRTTGFGKDGDNLAFYRTANTAQGRRLGTVYVSLGAEYFQGIAPQSLVSRITASCLVGPDGAVVMDVGDLDTSCRTADSARLLRLLDKAPGSYSARVEALGGHIIAVQRLRNHPLRVVQIATDDLLLQRWRSDGLYSLVAMGLVILAAWLFIRYLQHAAQRSLLARQELLQAQTHLQASHDLLDRLSQHVPGVIFQYRLYPDGRATMPYASEGLLDLFGVRPHDVQQDATPVLQRIHPDDLQPVLDAMHRSGVTRSPLQQEFRVLDDAQHTRWLATLANSMQLEDGSLLWHGFVKDITDRKMLEQAVYEHDRDMNTILENSSVGIAFLKGRNQVWANARMAEMFGYSMLEIVGRSTRMYYPSDEAFEALARDGYSTINRGER
jgi:PAS domain S-box-containing protein